MAVTSQNYSQAYKNGLEQGFSIVDARQYYVRELNMRPDLEQMMTTPWTCNGERVFGYTVTDVSSAGERSNGMRNTHTHEFWIYDSDKGSPRNLDDVYPNGYDLQDKNGKSITFTQAFDEMGDFASAASYYPHVFMASEYANARNYLNARMGLGEVTASDYAGYLEHVEKQLQSRDFTFIGKITKMSEVDIAWDSILEMPGGAEAMQAHQSRYVARDITQSIGPYDQ